MTIDTAKRFGGKILHNDYSEFFIEGGQSYEGCDFSIEGDWSAAAMLLVAGAVAGEVTLDNISTLSLQADTAICSALVHAGASVINEENSITVAKRDLQAFEFDATNCPDLFPALAALAAAAEGESEALLAGGLVIWLHRTNIGRLVKGCESKFYFKPKK